MTVMIENIPFPPSSKASIIVKILRDLPEGQCVTLFPETAKPKDLDRQRVLWYVSAKREGIAIVSRRGLNKEGYSVIRIWRTDYP